VHLKTLRHIVQALNTADPFVANKKIQLSGCRH